MIGNVRYAAHPRATLKKNSRFNIGCFLGLI
jgi:hypothetical protein